MTSDSVIAALEAALAAAPDDADLRAHLAGLLLDAGRPDQALEQATQVLAARPDHVPALRIAARAARATGEQARATAYDRLASALDPAGAVNEDPPGDVPEAAPVAESDGETRTPEPAYAAPGIPDTAEELLASWDGTDAAEEPLIGEIRPPRITLADVGGLADVKRRLESSFLAPMRNPELRITFGKSLRGGLLLWGPPGCGKTYIARALAGEMGANFYEVGLSDVLDMYIGASERNLHGVFEAARRNRPCVLFFDEIDALGQKRSQTRGSAMRGVVNQMLAELDGAETDNEGLFVLAATNHPWDVDSALVRPGRFDRTVLVLPPDAEAREAILRSHLADRPQERIDFAKLAGATDGFSGADLALVCEEATERALAASMSGGQIVPITQRDLVIAVKATRSSIGEWLETAKNYALFANDAGTYDELLPYLKQRRRGF